MDYGEKTTVEAYRVRAGRDLGEVHEGDHLLIVGGVVVAVDTSRPASAAPSAFRPPSVEKPRPRDAKEMLTKARKVGRLPFRHFKEINTDVVIQMLREVGPDGAPTIALGDRLNLARSDERPRAKITRLLTVLREQGKVDRATGPNGVYVYWLTKDGVSSGEEPEVTVDG